jgi:hypothetical protein
MPKSVNLIIGGVLGILLCLSSMTGCARHEVHTFKEWCELRAGIDLKERYAPVWVMKFTVVVDEAAVREDYVNFLNKALLKRVQYRVPRMAWHKDREIHLVNLSAVEEVPPAAMIEKWRQGIRETKEIGQGTATSRCLYGTLIDMFDELVIHSVPPDATGGVEADRPTVIQIQ